ncbi:MAG: sulfatase-like hydrolase/transferase [Kiritimatiellaeota bacterium]|nr:sulfatase-like hydrolase/transferase [Kiritimatiellota bacterium]
MPEQPLNLLFVMTDHQRADSIGAVQSGVEVTPNLNRLASAGVWFQRAYTTCPLCVPARTALATGVYPTQNGVVCNDWSGASAGNFPPLHELLAAAGYDVGHIGVHHIRVRPDLRRRVEFAFWVDSGDYRRHMAALGLDVAPEGGSRMFQREVTELQDGRLVRQWYSSTRTAVWPYAAEHFLDAYYCRRAVDWLRRPHPRPFALFLYLWAPHPPLRVPEPFASIFAPDRIDLPANVGRPALNEPAGRRASMPAQLAEGLDEAAWRRVWAAHLGLVNLADQGIGSVLRALDASGLASRTLTVFTVDHGEHLGQHAMYQKMEMYEPAVRVPLIIRLPGAWTGVSAVPVSHLDVVPTVCDCLGLSRPDAPSDGESLGPTVEQGLPPHARPVFLQYSGNATRGVIRRAVVHGRWKYVYTPDDAPELFDLEDDPLETLNVAGCPENAARLIRLHRLVRRWHRARRDWVSYESGMSALAAAGNCPRPLA